MRRRALRTQRTPHKHTRHAAQHHHSDILSEKELDALRGLAVSPLDNLSLFDFGSLRPNPSKDLGKWGGFLTSMGDLGKAGDALMSDYQYDRKLTVSAFVPNIGGSSRLAGD
jgi:hypothetical protein